MTTSTLTTLPDRDVPAADRARARVRPVPLPGRVETAPRVGFGRLVRVEARKFVNTRAGFWLLVLTALASIAATVGAGLAFEPLSRTLGVDPAPWTMPANLTSFAIMLALPVMAVLAITQEWSQHTALTTFTGEPRRLRVVGAKAVVALGAGLTGFVLTLALTAVSALVGQLAGTTVAWAMEWRQLAGLLLYVLLTVALGFGFGLATMNAPAAVVAYFAVPTLMPLLSLAGQKVDAVMEWIDITRAQAPFVGGEAISSGQWARLATSVLLWIVVPVAVGLWRHARREVK